MIFVTVGTTHFPFERLLEAVAALRVDEPIVVQRGPSEVVLENANVVDFMSYGEVSENVRRSRVVVSHAGVGSIMVALGHGRRPVVVPRLARYGEAVDDHQIDVARMLDERGQVTLVEEPDQLARVLETIAPDRTGPSIRFGPLVEHVAAEVRAATGGRRRSDRP